MPDNGQLSGDDYLTWWFRAVVTGTGAMVSLALAIVLFCHAIRSQTLGTNIMSDAIDAALAGGTLGLLGASSYAVGRAHGLAAHHGHSL